MRTRPEVEGGPELSQRIWGHCRAERRRRDGARDPRLLEEEEEDAIAGVMAVGGNGGGRLLVGEEEAIGTARGGIAAMMLRAIGGWERGPGQAGRGQKGGWAWGAISSLDSVAVCPLLGFLSIVTFLWSQELNETFLG